MSRQQDTTSPLVIEQLSFRYRSREEPALRDISLTLERGELLLVAGASGCGKTTLIRCVNGLVPRSWLEQLHYRRWDRVLQGFGVVLLVVYVALSLLGLGRLWVPDWALAWAGG